MNSTGANTSSLEPKKRLRSSVSKPHPSGEPLKTPEKPTNPPRRVLTHRQQSLRSVRQIREAAKQLQKPDLKPSDPLTSDSTEIEVVKPNAVKSLPEKYEMLNKFFHSLTSSVRLLRLKGSMPTFTNISHQVQSLTDRSFGYNHLGQLKFIMPEAIEIKKILIRDDRTSCMKPDLHITLNFTVVENEEKMSSDCAYLRLTKLFRSRLVKFCESSPEGGEVPREELPEPFNQSNKTYTNAIRKPDRVQVLDTTRALYEQQPPIAASHMPQSFKRRFSKQVPIEDVETDKKESNVLTSETQVDHGSNKVMSPVKWSATLPETPIRGSVSTPSKLVSTPFTATPAQSARPPVRCLLTPDEESTMSPSKLNRRSSGRGLRSITFDTPVKDKTAPAKRVSSVDDDDDDFSDILSHDLLASIRERELKVLEENNPEISQAKWRKQMIARLPKLFDTLLFYFQSIKRTVITKPELVNMIVSNQLEIVDPREIEEQLRLLLDLAPEWAYEKTASSGDLLFCVNKISSPESIRTRLSEAN